MENKEKKIVEYTMGFGKVNLIAILLFIPIAIVFITPFILIWDYPTFIAGKNSFMPLFLPILIVGAVIHELLHGITWGYFAKNKMKSIKFGVKWQYITPYCHCKEPLKVKHYWIGGAMPLIIMGIIPAIVAIAIGNSFLLHFGIFFSWAAGGDIISLFMLRKLDRNSYVSDHPTEMGFYQEVEQEDQPASNTLHSI